MVLRGPFQLWPFHDSVLRFKWKGKCFRVAVPSHTTSTSDELLQDLISQLCDVQRWSRE